MTRAKITWFFRKWKEVAHFQNNQSFYGMRDNLKSGYPNNNSGSALLTKFIYFIAKTFHTNKSILFIEKLQFFSLP